MIKKIRISRGNKVFHSTALVLTTVEIASLMVAVLYGAGTQHPSTWLLATLGVFIPGSATITLLLMLLLRVLRKL